MLYSRPLWICGGFHVEVSVSMGASSVSSSQLSCPDSWGERWDGTSLVPKVSGWEVCRLFCSFGVEWKFDKTLWVAGIQAYLLALGGWWSRSHQSPVLNQNWFCIFFLVPSGKRGFIRVIRHCQSLPICRHCWLAHNSAGWLLFREKPCTRQFHSSVRMVWWPRDSHHSSHFSCLTLLTVSLASPISCQGLFVFWKVFSMYPPCG